MICRRASCSTRAANLGRRRQAAKGMPSGPGAELLEYKMAERTCRRLNRNLRVSSGARSAT
eukprot:9604205-Lingulodinium_polyedra.AAC.1